MDIRLAGTMNGIEAARAAADTGLTVTWEMAGQPFVLMESAGDQAELMSDPERAPRVTQAFMGMKKLDIAALPKA